MSVQASNFSCGEKEELTKVAGYHSISSQTLFDGNVDDCVAFQR